MNPFNSHLDNVKLGKEQTDGQEAPFGGLRTSPLAPGCSHKGGEGGGWTLDSLLDSTLPIDKALAPFHHR